MKRSKRLGTINRVFHDREDHAAQALQRSQGALVLQQRRLQQLIEYQKEYHQQFVVSGQQGLSAKKLLDFRAFMESLAQAVENQRQLVKRHLADYEDKKRQWMAAHTKTGAVEGLIDAAQQVEALQEEKAVQRELDDRGRKHTTGDDITD